MFTIIFGITGLALFALAGAATWFRVDPRALVIEAAGGVAGIVMAGMGWIAEVVRDRDKDALLEAMGAFSRRRAMAQTAPLRRVV